MSNETSNGFGKTKVNDEFDGFLRLKMKTPDKKKGEQETVLVARLLPSMHSYRDTGRWRFFYGQHFGYSGNNPRDPGKPKARPFKCVQKKSKRVITEHCPKCDQMSKYFDEKDKREEQLAKQHGFEDKEKRKASDAWWDIKDKDPEMKRLGMWLQKHNCDKKFHMNVMTLEGKFGVLALSFDTCENVLMPLLNRLEDGSELGKKVDPFDPAAGYYLKFTRTGTIPRVKDAIEVYKRLDKISDQEVLIPVKAPLTQEQCERALKVCPDLVKDIVTEISRETIQQLVDCSGDPDEVDRIWPPKPRAEKAAEKPKPPAEEHREVSRDEGAEEEFDNEGDAPGHSKSAPAATTSAIAPASTPAPAVTTPAEDDLDAQIAALQAKRAAKSAPAPDPGLGKTKEVNSPDTFLGQFEPR